MKVDYTNEKDIACKLANEVVKRQYQMERYSGKKPKLVIYAGYLALQKLLSDRKIYLFIQRTATELVFMGYPVHQVVSDTHTDIIKILEDD